MFWCFAIINNRLAEIFYDGEKPNSMKIFGHAYVNKDEYSTKQEQEWITKDTKKLNFTYRKGIYKSKITGLKIKSSSFHFTQLFSTPLQ